MKDCFVGIDFGKTNMRFAIAEDRPELKYFTKRPYERGTPDEMHRQIFEGIDQALEEAGYQRHNVRGIGIAVPAVVNRKTGTRLGFPGRGIPDPTDRRALRRAGCGRCRHRYPRLGRTLGRHWKRVRPFCVAGVGYGAGHGRGD